mgnify:CR=1 FL=1
MCIVNYCGRKLRMVSHNSFNNHIDSIGQLAEIEAQHFLEHHGLILREQNFITYDINGKKCGEIDLIMRDKSELVFVEVKARSDEKYGHVLEMIPKPKQNRIIRTATKYLVQHNLYNTAACRFDVIGINWNQKNQKPDEIFWIKNAFEVEY